jgi:DNA primase
MKRENPSIKPILEHYGARVPNRNNWFSMKCPFHEDSHASASASLKENAFCCFACQMKGNAYAIIMKKEGVDFREAVSIAEGILNQSGEALPQRIGGSRGLSAGSRSNYRSSNKNGIGRRARALNGA